MDSIVLLLVAFLSDGWVFTSDYNCARAIADGGEAIAGGHFDSKHLSIHIRSVTPSPIQESCEDDLQLMCPFNDIYDSIHEDGFSLLQEQTLSRHCKKACLKKEELYHDTEMLGIPGYINQDIIQDIECKKNYLSRCNPGEVEAFSLATDGVKDVLVEVCNEATDLRKAYRVHSSCIASVENQYENCILSLADHVEPEDYGTNENDVTSKDVVIRRLCRFYEPFKNCVTQVTRTSCGDSAAQMVEQLVVRMATPAVSAKCSPTTDS